MQARHRGRQRSVVETQTAAILSFGKACANRLKSTPKRSISVLIVDDEEALLKFVNRVLSEDG